MLPDDDLDRIAARGRARARAARAARAQAQGHAVGAAARARARNQAKSLSAFVGWGWLALGIGLGVLLAPAFAPYLPDDWWVAESNDGDPATLALLAVSAVPSFLLWLLRPVVGSAAVTREAASLAALPFRVAGYIESLGREPSDATVSLEIEFSGTPAPRALVADVFRTIGGDVKDGKDPSRSRVSRRFEFESSVSSSSYVVHWVRRATPILIALHGRHPVAQVTVGVTS